MLFTPENIAILVVVALVLYVLFTYNSLVRLRNKAREAFSTMDVCMKKRHDLIPSLVEVVKGYAAHETSALLETTALRQSAHSANSPYGQPDASAGEARISGALRSVFVAVERYPELKADSQFLELQQRLSRIEDEISLSRRYYNGCVREYNNNRQVFPLNLVAALFRFEDIPMFAVGSDEERAVVNVDV